MRAILDLKQAVRGLRGIESDRLVGVLCDLVDAFADLVVQAPQGAAVRQLEQRVGALAADVGDLLDRVRQAGTAIPLALPIERAPAPRVRQFAPKTCRKCRQTYTPTGSRQWFCAGCRA